MKTQDSSGLILVTILAAGMVLLLTVWLLGPTLTTGAGVWFGILEFAAVAGIVYLIGSRIKP